MYSFPSPQNPVRRCTKVKTERRQGSCLTPHSVPDGPPGAAAQSQLTYSPGSSLPRSQKEPPPLCFPPRYGRAQGPSGVCTDGDHPHPALEVPVGQVRPLPPQLQPSLRPARGGAASQRQHLLRSERPAARAGVRRPPESREGPAQEQARAHQGVHR